MATFREIATEYAQKIKKAIGQTELEKTASVELIKEAFSKRDPLVEIFKNIQDDLNKYTSTTTDKPLSEDEKKRILTITGEILGLSEPVSVVYIVKEASNENAIALSTYISQIINELKEKE